MSFCLNKLTHTHTHKWGGSTLHPQGVRSWSRLTCYHTVQPTTCMGTLSTTYTPAGLNTQTHSQTKRRGKCHGASNLTITQSKAPPSHILTLFSHPCPNFAVPHKPPNLSTFATCVENIELHSTTACTTFNKHHTQLWQIKTERWI